MPFWRFYTPPGLWTTKEKQQLASLITHELYFMFPSFYVNVVFFEVEPTDLYVGGVSSDNKFVRIDISHISRHISGDSDESKNWKNGVEAVLKPFVADKGLRYEWGVAETPMELWHVDGIDPPPEGSEPYYKWYHTGEALPYDKATLRMIRTEASSNGV